MAPPPQFIKRRVAVLSADVIQRIIFYTLAESSGVTYRFSANGKCHFPCINKSVELPEFIRVFDYASTDHQCDLMVGCNYIKDIFHRVRDLRPSPYVALYNSDGTTDESEDDPTDAQPDDSFDREAELNFGGVVEVEDAGRIVYVEAREMAAQDAFTQCLMASNLAITARKLRRVSRNFCQATGLFMREFRDNGYPASLVGNDLLDDDISKLCDKMERIRAIARMSKVAEEAALEVARRAAPTLT